MRLDMSKFGLMLISRPAGREAYLAARAYLFDDASAEVVLDFSGVKVLTPSWADAFLQNFRADFKGSILYQGTENPSVRATLSLLDRVQHGEFSASL
ncbi:DUF4325 domain-containing protein [Candidatus Berkelbacteria bacterium]|nr:DUF4325 domain-containing protein [Candidatus Berkelbacteria bacterium]